MSTTKETGGKYTALGTNFFTWEPLASQPVHCRFLWLALYTSNHARCFPPGLWSGGVPVMSEAANLEADVVWDALDKLMVAELVEFDRLARVARLTRLPDAHERASGWTHCKAWWTKFNLVPRCDVRDAHVKTLRWLVDQGKVNADLERVWGDTFGTIKTLPNRRRGSRRLADSDTATAVQPSLFPSQIPPPLEPLPPAASRDAKNDRGSTTTEVREHPHAPVSDPLNPNDIKNSDSEGVWEGVSEGVWEGVRGGDRDRDFSSSGDPDQGEPPVDRAPRPALALVPYPEDDAPFTVDELVAVFGQTTLTLPTALREALRRSIRELRSCSVTKADVALLAQAVRDGVMPERIIEGRRCVGWERVYAMVESSALMDVIERSRDRSRRIDENRRTLAEAREKAGV